MVVVVVVLYMFAFPDTEEPSACNQPKISVGLFQSTSEGHCIMLLFAVDLTDIINCTHVEMRLFNRVQLQHVISHKHPDLVLPLLP